MRVLAGSICTGFLLLCIAGCGGASSTDEVPSKDTKAGEQSSRLPPKTLAPADEAAVAGQPSKNSSGALPGGTVDLRFVPKQALAALVMYPSRFLGRPPIAKVNMKEALAELEAELGVPVSEIEQLVTMFVLIPAGDPDEGHPALDMAFEMRLARPHDGTALAKKVIQPGPPEKAEIAGKAYFRPNSKGPTRAYQKAVYVIDERTFLCGDEAAIKAILSGGPATTPLTELLAKVDPAADLTVVSTGNDRLTKAREYFGPPIQAFAGVAHALGADYGAMASTTLSPNMSLKFTLFAQDNAGAGKIAALMPQAKQQAVAVQTMLRQEAGQATGNQKPMVEYAAATVGKIVAAFPPQQTGKQFSLQVDNLGTLDSFVADVLAPAFHGAERKKAAFASYENLERISGAFISYEHQHGQLPAATVRSKDGKPLLSWRVTILPLLEQKELYAQFHLDEPWDSPANKPLIAKMPAVYRDFSTKSLDPGQTRYLCPIGKGTMFAPDGSPHKIDEPIRHDRMLAVVEVGQDKAVTWTKPDDLPFDPDQPLAALGTIPEEGFYAVGMGLVPTHIQRNVSGDAFRRLVEGDPPPEPQDPESLRQQALIDKYKKLGASVERWHGRDDQTMISLALEGEKITDGDLKDLAKFKNLFGLSLRGTKVTDAGLKDVGAIQTLTNLTLLFSPNTTAAGMKEIAGLKRLTSLSIAFANLDDAGLKEIGRITTLKSLDIEKTAVTDAGIAQLAPLKQLESLDLFGDHVTGTGFKSLADLTRLEELKLGYTIVNDAGLKEIGQLPGLKRLHLGSTKVTDEGLKELANLKHLETLELGETGVTGAGLGELAKLEHFVSLDLNRTKASDDGLKEIGKLTSLNYLFVSRTEVTDAGLKELANLKSLRFITLDNTRVTDAGVAELKKLLPNCKIRSKD